MGRLRNDIWKSLASDQRHGAERGILAGDWTNGGESGISQSIALRLCSGSAALSRGATPAPIGEICVEVVLFELSPSPVGHTLLG